MTTSLAPTDVLAQRPASLRRLEVLVGRWRTEASFGGGLALAETAPAGSAPAGESASAGETTFEWMEGGRFLVQRFTCPVPEAPDGMAVIGAIAETDAYTQHYYDSRGVARVYRMTLDGTDWTLWRESPGFCQRYIATISPDGAMITGDWETSADGGEWEHDFTLTYRKLG